MLEILAVGFGVAYLLLAVREHIACWYAAAISTLLSIYIFWNVSLLMESLLNGYYLIMAGYGWWQWRYGGDEAIQAGRAAELAITRWPIHRHLIAVLMILLASALSGYLLDQYSQAAWPYLDSFTTWGSVFTTYLVARKVLENWYYWFVIDAVSIVLYLDKALYWYAALFAAYLVIVIFGYQRWQRQYAASQQQASRLNS